MLVGSHVSMSGKKMLLGSAEEAAKYGANTFMIYTGAPQNTRRKPIEELNIEAGHTFMAAHDLGHIVVHAPYIVNLGNTFKPESFAFAVDFLREEVKRADALGAEQIVLHPGAHVGAGPQAAIQSIIKGLNEILTPDQHAQIAIETMAGKGTEVGITFDQIAEMIDGVTLNDKLSVCFDTCHTSDAGYDIKGDFDGVMNDFDQIIGLDRLKVIHLNDSKNPQGAHKDRHTNLGYGTIGFDRLNQIAHDERFVNVPKIMETPYVAVDPENKPKDKRAPYGYEIAELKAGKFNDHLVSDITHDRPYDEFLN
ncbi:deoxyribonuclease IV [Furfurilactobacillus milii]|uniref:deoxyribonuclease IV n=1 Tax=Furfurilactobacillus milii TaxID=2888272 RepID=UPI001EED590A|nr:deoxyribonuclease IV [Furfurilactobacillus milii]MCF6419315.1 deoxyribonuclease IV [Furfurilactobacillus milii]